MYNQYIGQSLTESIFIFLIILGPNCNFRPLFDSEKEELKEDDQCSVAQSSFLHLKIPGCAEVLTRCRSEVNGKMVVEVAQYRWPLHVQYSVQDHVNRV